MNTIILPKAQVIRYIWLLIGVGFMILSIRVYVNNYLTIENSIIQAQQDIIRTQSETDFIRNFQLPYLQTELARRMAMHAQQIADVWGTIVQITYEEAAPINEIINKWSHQIARAWWINFIIYQWKRSNGCTDC
jgi:hypothetical protein